MNNQATQTQEAPAFGELVQIWVDAKFTDAKGRRVGFIVGFCDNGIDFYVNVQKGVMDNKRNFEAFGAAQRSKKFKSMEQAKRHGYGTAKERIAKLHASK